MRRVHEFIVGFFSRRELGPPVVLLLIINNVTDKSMALFCGKRLEYFSEWEGVSFLDETTI